MMYFTEVSVAFPFLLISPETIDGVPIFSDAIKLKSHDKARRNYPISSQRPREKLL